MYRVWNFLTNYSLLLIFGAVIALMWANTNPHSYHHLVEYPLWFNDWLGPSYKYWAKAYGDGYDTFASGGASKCMCTSVHICAHMYTYVQICTVRYFFFC